MMSNFVAFYAEDVSQARGGDTGLVLHVIIMSHSINNRGITNRGNTKEVLSLRV